ncbi:MAG TPA: fused MFS/spermidine synthase [Acidothermaceae bacterium]|jgi:spermidine synthase|nr:fused MFS/spermidine synthase [Acidothermaceae bacterium]
MPRERGAAGDSFTVDTATATLVRDISRRAAWTLLLDGVESSHVDLDDPTILEFEYVQWLGDIIDCLAPAGDPVDTVHLGGGAMTVARYVMATRPASKQVVFEIDGALVELVRERLPWTRGLRTRRLRVRVGDARQGLVALADASWDLVVRDAFRDAVVPADLRTVESATRVKSVLRPSGVYLMNVTDRAPFSVTGVELATLLEVFTEVALISEPSVLRGRRHGNLIIAAANRPLPLEAIARRIADGAVQGRVRDLGQAKEIARGHRPLRDAGPGQ